MYTVEKQATKKEQLFFTEKYYKDAVINQIYDNIDYSTIHVIPNFIQLYKMWKHANWSLGQVFKYKGLYFYFCSINGDEMQVYNKDFKNIECLTLVPLKDIDDLKELFERLTEKEIKLNKVEQRYFTKDHSWLWKQIQKQNIKYSHHESDLYIPVNHKTKDLIERYEFRKNVKEFVSEVENTLWYDIPFGYMPFWRK